MANISTVERLTPLDLLMPRTYIKVFLTFRTTEPIPAARQRLQNGLDGLSKAIPWLRGHVFPTSASRAPSGLEIRWNSESPVLTLEDKGLIGASYETLSAERMPPESIPTNVWPVPSMIDDSLFTAGAPVFGASCFQFADKNAIGVCIGIHHNATDATGFADIIRCWSQQVTEPTNLFSPQAIGRVDRLSKELSSNIEVVASQSTEALFKSHPEYSASPPVFPTEFHPCKYKIFAIPLSRVHALKEDLGRHMAHVPTTNTIACALIWSAIARARSKRNADLLHETSQLAVAVNGRQRLSEAFSSPGNPYLGNLVLYSLTQLSVKDLVSSEHEDFVSTVANICDGLSQSQSPAQVNPRRIAEVHSLVDRVEDYKTVFVGWDLFSSRDLTITSWAGLDLYDMSFGEGLGKPEFVRIPGSEADGVGIVLPRKRNASAIDSPNEVIEAMVMLRKDDLDTLERDGIWKNFVV